MNVETGIHLIIQVRLLWLQTEFSLTEERQR